MWAICLSLGAAETAWQTVVSDEGGFTVEMPGQPEERKPPAGPAGANLVEYIVANEASQATYIVASTSLPERAPQWTPNQRLDAMRDASLAAVSGKLREDGQRNLELGDHPGRELRFTGAGYDFELRLYVVDQRLIQLGAVRPEREPRSADVDRFFASVKLRKSH